MALICVICEDLLSQGEPRAQSSTVSMDPTFLTCGHMFHHECLRKWFEGNGGLNQLPGFGTCPKCKRISSLQGAFRAFPDTESTDIVEANTRVRELTKENEEALTKIRELAAANKGLVVKMNELRAVSDQRVAEVENKRGEDQLKLAEALSTIDTLNQEAEDRDNIIKAMEESARAYIKPLRQEEAKTSEGAKTAEAAKRKTDDIEILWEVSPTPAVYSNATGGAGPSRLPKQRRTNFIFLPRDKQELQSFVEKALKENPWAKNSVRQLAESFMRSTYYKEMTRGRDEPCSGTLERRIRDICKNVTVAYTTNATLASDDVNLD